MISGSWSSRLYKVDGKIAQLSLRLPHKHRQCRCVLTKANTSTPASWRGGNRHRYRSGRSGVPPLGRSNRMQHCQRLATTAMILRCSKLCCPDTKPRRWPRHSLHASAYASHQIINLFFFYLIIVNHFFQRQTTKLS